MRIRRPAALLAAAAVALAGCSAPPPKAVPSEAEDYVYPAWTPTDLSRDEGRDLEKAWQSVSSGQGVEGEKRFRELLRKHPGSAPAETGIGYALLRQGRAPDAARAFLSVLERKPDYVPALVGAGSAALRAGSGEDALQRFRRAASLDPSNETVRRRLSEVRLQVTERRVAAARAALAGGSTGAAITAYRADVAKLNGTLADWKTAYEHVADCEERNRQLTAQLTAATERLDWINASLGWRLLNVYGRIKYRYLLPIYRWFH